MIINAIFVGIGGFFGAIARYLISEFQKKITPSFPYGTLIVNLLGSLLLGLFTGSSISSPWILLLGTGFMGAFTTFSTLNLESVQFRFKQKWGNLFWYLGITYTMGILLASIGYLLSLLLKVV